MKAKPVDNHSWEEERREIFPLYSTESADSISNLRLFPNFFFCFTKWLPLVDYLNVVLHFAHHFVSLSETPHVKVSHTLPKSFSLHSKFTLSFLFLFNFIQSKSINPAVNAPLNLLSPKPITRKSSRLPHALKPYFRTKSFCKACY